MICSGRGAITASCTPPSGQTCAVSLVAGIGRGGDARGHYDRLDRWRRTNVLTLKLNRTGKRTLARRKRMTVILRGTLRAAGSAKLTKKLPVRAGQTTAAASSATRPTDDRRGRTSD
jgi:hypothetical protein